MDTEIGIKWDPKKQTSKDICIGFDLIYLAAAPPLTKLTLPITIKYLLKKGLEGPSGCYPGIWQKF